MSGNLSHRQKAIASAQRTYQGPTPKVLKHDSRDSLHCGGLLRRGCPEYQNGPAAEGLVHPLPQKKTPVEWWRQLFQQGPSRLETADM